MFQLKCYKIDERTPKRALGSQLSNQRRRLKAANNKGALSKRRGNRNTRERIGLKGPHDRTSLVRMECNKCPSGENALLVDHVANLPFTRSTPMSNSIDT